MFASPRRLHHAFAATRASRASSVAIAALALCGPLAMLAQPPAADQRAQARKAAAEYFATQVDREDMVLLNQ